MKYTFNHSNKLITINITNNNDDKHVIEGGVLKYRKCGDCKIFLPLTSFSIRDRNNKLIINTKCDQCHKIRSLIRNSFKTFKKDSPTEKIIGISYEKFIQWLDKNELKHTQKGLHIDHTIPKSLAETLEDAKLLNHYSNLKLMVGLDNLKKSNKVINGLDVENVFKHSPNPNRLKELILKSKIKII